MVSFEFAAQMFFVSYQLVIANKTVICLFFSLSHMFLKQWIRIR